MTERVRADLKSVNIKIEYSKALDHFSKHLKVSDKAQKKQAFILWSALHYIGKDRFSDYRSKYISRFNKTLSSDVREKFLQALPPSMNWARNELGH